MSSDNGCFGGFDDGHKIRGQTKKTNGAIDQALMILIRIHNYNQPGTLTCHLNLGHRNLSPVIFLQKLLSRSNHRIFFADHQTPFFDRGGIRSEFPFEN
jgi:hypothetical protein